MNRVPFLNIRSQDLSGPSPDVQTRWGLPFGLAKERLRLMKSDGMRASTPEEKLLLRFMYAKGIFNHMWTDDIRKDLISTFAFGGTSALKQDIQAARQRLLRLLCPTGNDFVADAIPSNVLHYSRALRVLSSWGETSDTYIFFDDACGKWSVARIQRVQHSGLCYMHAPVVLQSYLVSKNAWNQKFPTLSSMIDISNFIVTQFTPRDLCSHIVDDEGGTSFDFLERILEPGSIITDVPASSVDKSMLERYGPALVHQFIVHEDFKILSSLSYLNLPYGTVIGRHSMLLVGVRTQGNKKVFLLQNWWAKQQFVEVSSDYFTTCKGQIAFVETPQTRIPSAFPVQRAIFGASAALDKSERCFSERVDWNEPLGDRGGLVLFLRYMLPIMAAREKKNGN
jgi:hypothetical protein